MLRHSLKLGRKGIQICGLLILLVAGYRLWGYSGTHLSNPHVVLESSKDKPHLPTLHLQYTTTASNGQLNRYILSLNYWEQLTMATANLFSLVCLGKLWNTTIVQPFTYNSRLYGLRNFKPDDNFKQSTLAQSLDLIYDTNSLKESLLHYQLPQLTDFKTFINNSSRDVTVAHYISSKEAHELNLGQSREKIEVDFKENSIINCKGHLYRILVMIEKALNSELEQQGLPPNDRFRIINYWCVNMSDFNTPHNSAARMELRPEENVTLVVVNWRGMGSKRVFRSIKGDHLNNRIAMSNSTCKHYGSKNVIAYSSHVMQAYKLFRASLGIKEGAQFAAIHIRSEKLGLREPRIPGVTAECIKELMRLKDVLALEKPSMRFIYLTDYNPYSSDTCKNCRGSRYVKKYLHKSGITATYFEPSHFNMTLDNGFAAAVDSQFLASANFLFLCGGGGYQGQISARFHKLKQQGTDSNSEKKLFRVCNEDKKISKLISRESWTPTANETLQ